MSSNFRNRATSLCILSWFLWRAFFFQFVASDWAVHGLRNRHYVHEAPLFSHSVSIASRSLLGQNHDPVNANLPVLLSSHYPTPLLYHFPTYRSWNLKAGRNLLSNTYTRILLTPWNVISIGKSTMAVNPDTIQQNLETWFLHLANFKASN